MKSLTIFFLMIFPLASIAQISEEVNKQLPDSLRPANINEISYFEVKKILNNYVVVGPLDEINQIDKLCVKFTPLIKNLKTDKEKLGHFLVVSKYWLNRFIFINKKSYFKKSISDSSFKYLELNRKYIQKGSKDYDSNLARYYALMGHLNIYTANYSDGYSNLLIALGMYKVLKNYNSISYLYFMNAQMYHELELYPQAIMYYDSALQLNAVKNMYDINNQGQVHILCEKASIYSDLYASTRINRYKDSVINITKKIIRSRAPTRFRSMAFDILARLNYHQGNYFRSISFTDSSLAVSRARGRESEEIQMNSLIFKALSLIKIGKKEEGLALVKINKIQGNGPEAGKLLEELYKSEREKGNLKSAILYLERFQKFKESSGSVKGRGQIFEIQQKYDLAAKDLRILQYRDDEKRGKLIVGVVGLVICFSGLLLGIRFRNNQRKANFLVDQINELTQLQILRIEDEKEKERRRIGQELHDGLSGSIAAGVRYLRMIAEDELRTENKIRLSEISDMLERDYNKARGKSHELYLVESDENFWKGLANNIDIFFAGINIEVSFNRETSGLILTPEVKTTILLVIRESITNVIRHSKASEVEILIYTEVKKLVLEVNDNGQGILSGSFSKNVGLKSINERVSNLNGKMTIQAQSPTGTNLRVEIPIAE